MSSETFGNDGDKVHHSEGRDGVITRNRIDSDNEIRVSFDNGCSSRYVNIRRLTLIPETPVEPETPTGNWTFKVSSIQAIDWPRMESDLTNSKPLLNINVDMGEGVVMPMVMVQRALLRKAKACKIKLPVAKDGYVDGKDGNIFIVRNHIAEWVSWGKKVKDAAWPKAMQQTAVVSAQQISV